MKNLISTSLTIACVSVAFVTTASALPITGMAGTSSHAIVETFAGLGPNEHVGIFFGSGGLQVAEGFVGQTISGGGDSSGFETFSGTPTGQLTLEVPAAEDGLWGCCGGVAGIAGNFILGVIGSGDIGEGVVSMLFAQDQLEIGFNQNGSGDVTVGFFARDGSILDTVLLTGFKGDRKYTSNGPAFAGS